VRSRKRSIALGALVAGALAWPASAMAGTAVSVTGDDGVPQALTGQSIKNMAPQLAFAPDAGQSFSAIILGPDGQNAAQAVLPCSAAALNRPVTYRGNGVYTVRVSAFLTGDCTGAAGTSDLTFSIGAGVSLSPDPNTPLLTRQPGEFATVTHRFPFTGNPGADTYDVLYSGNPAIAADGGLVGPSDNATVDAATSTVPLRFSEPGRYTIIARARMIGSGGAATPWTTPLRIRVYAPFDFSSSSFPDSRGPSYRLSVRLREETARGRVRISVARNWTGRAVYRTIGTVRIRNGGFTKRFTLSRTGKYRIRYRFEGSATTAPGTVTEKVRIRRTARASMTR
jgi:hypothetical protein